MCGFLKLLHNSYLSVVYFCRMLFCSTTVILFNFLNKCRLERPMICLSYYTSTKSNNCLVYLTIINDDHRGKGIVNTSIINAEIINGAPEHLVLNWHLVLSWF